MARWLLIGMGCVLLACEKDHTSPADASPSDLPTGQSDGLSGSEKKPLSAVDFVVQGCRERTDEVCKGFVPLVLAFSSVLQERVQSAKWDFSDGSSAQTGEVVTHTYQKVGTFTVTLSVGSGAGTLSEQKDGLVIVEAAHPGSPCGEDSDCGGGTCVCKGSCAFPLDTGLCLQECGVIGCHLPSTVCVDLSKGVPSNGEPWRTRLCLPTCQTDQDCTRPGFSCRLAPGASSWHRVCLPPSLRSIGEPCRTPTGNTDEELCLGGVCLDIGGSGYCSAACGSDPCPEGTRCAALASESASSVCLLRCDGDLCAEDPMLGCELPGGKGAYSFQILGPADPPGTQYCAPKRCSTDGECGFLGYCDSLRGGYCLPRGMKR
jgi:PKD repeat protein